MPRLKRPIRVMHVLFGLHAGGMEYGVVKIVNGLERDVVSSSICSTRPAGPLKDLLAAHVGLFEGRRRAGNDLRIVSYLYRLFRRERPDIVHTHAWGTLCEGLVAARLARVPLVVHGEHGTLQLAARQRHMQRWAWGRADALLSVSSRLAERMSETTGVPLSSIRVIRNGVDLTRFGRADTREARAALSLPQDRLLVGSVGRLVPVKDQATLIEAVALLRRQGIDVDVVLAGDGPLRTALEEQATALGLRESLHLTGHRPDVENVLSALDIFVLSSVSEGLSNTILEAMATGLPVVATAVGGADELVVDAVTGMLVPAGTPTAMANALAQLVQDVPRRERMGKAARERAETEFSLAGMVRAYRDLYVSLARRGVSDLAAAAEPGDVPVGGSEAVW